MRPGGQPPEKMDLDQLDLNPRIIAAVKKAKLKSVKEILHFSGADLQRLTNLSSPDVQHVLRAAASHLRGSPALTALHLLQQRDRCPSRHGRLSLGCPGLDRFLRGGLPLQGITELAGRSSAGKTQLALQLCLAVQFPRRHGGLEAGAVYVCTEDAFPSRRLQQLIQQQPQLRTDVPAEVVQRARFGDRIFVEHVADVDALLRCLHEKVPVLLSRGMARLVVVDSVAAPFRGDPEGQQAWALRARRLQSLGAQLHRLSRAFQSPVLCINQVTEAMEEWAQAPGPPGPWDERLAPALGIAWASQLLMRLMADRLQGPGAGPRPTRVLRVLFAPHLPPSSCFYTVGAEGVRRTSGPRPVDAQAAAAPPGPRPEAPEPRERGGRPGRQRLAASGGVATARPGSP